MQQRSGRLIDRSQGADRNKLEVIVSLQSGIFLTLNGEINARVSRGANNCHVPRQGPAAFKRVQNYYCYFFTLGIKDPEGLGKKLEENVSE